MELEVDTNSMYVQFADLKSTVGMPIDISANALYELADIFDED